MRRRARAAAASKADRRRSRAVHRRQFGSHRLMAWSAIAFDLATTTGWAWHAEGMPGPYFDAFTLPGDPGDVGKPAAALEEWLRIIYRRTKEEGVPITHRSEEHTSELQSLMRI